MKNLKEFCLEEKVRRLSMYLSRFLEGDKKKDWGKKQFSN